MVSRVFLIRHGETEWSKVGKHTGRTEVPLSAEGEREAGWLLGRLSGAAFSHVLVSPRQRALRTCEIAGWSARAESDGVLSEWDYGSYEGLTSSQIHESRPGWELFRDGCPGGESPEAASARADRLIGRLRAMVGDVALFSHGHFCRALGARWCGLPVSAGAGLLLGTASVSILGFEHGSPQAPGLALWNENAR
jgi:probable phosphoglycerate mutase